MLTQPRTPAAGTEAPPSGRPRDPVVLASAGFLALCLLFALPPLLSESAQGFYEAGFLAMHEAMAGMAVACQWTY
ncbi:MAG: hypothetical protein WD341_11300 [Tistlia sp.]|uniref:hypothetical protein n=1 Tax=Tistlia sp. TaxID=3057121 RepID=UPI0034A3E00A